MRLEKSHKVIFLFIVSLGFAYLVFVFWPAQNQIESANRRTYALQADLIFNNLEHQLSQFKLGAQSVASRSFIAQQLASYYHGTKELEKVRKLSNPKYLDGIGVLSHCQAACRLSGSTYIVCTGSETLYRHQAPGEELLNGDVHLCFLKDEDGALLCRYTVPIRHREQLVGHDVIFFSLQDFLETTNQQFSDFRIGPVWSDESGFSELQAGKTVKGSGQISFTQTFGDDSTLFAVQVPESKLAKGMSVLNHSLVPFLFSLVLVGLLSVFYRRKADVKLLQEQKGALDTTNHALEDQNSRLENSLKDLEDAWMAVSESNEKLKSILAAVSDGIVVIDQKGKMITCNLAAEEILGLSGKMLQKGMPVPENWEAFWEGGESFWSAGSPFEKALQTGVSQRNVLLSIKKPGKSTTWAHVNAEPIYGNLSSGKPIAVVTSFTEITKLKEHQWQLQELNATKDKFFSIISHDLRGPLNNISALFELLQVSYQESGTMDEEVAMHIEKSIQRSRDLLTDLLEWSRAQTGHISVNPSIFTDRELIEANFQMLANQAGAKSIALLQETPQKECKVIADRNMVDTVLRNLLSNAIKFTEKGGEIVMKSEQRSPEQVHFSIIDNGVGMTEKVKKNLFKIDECQSVPGTEGEHGTGLGLIVCKEFIEKNGGEIWVQSEKGKGTTFTFSLAAPTQKVIAEIEKS